MGLLFNVLTFPVSGPLKGAMWGMNKVSEQAERLYYDEDSIRQQLLELETRFEFGEIDEATFEEAEQQLLDRLEEGRARRQGRPDDEPGDAPSPAPLS